MFRSDFELDSHATDTYLAEELIIISTIPAIIKTVQDLHISLVIRDIRRMLSSSLLGYKFAKDQPDNNFEANTIYIKVIEGKLLSYRVMKDFNSLQRSEITYLNPQDKDSLEKLKKCKKFQDPEKSNQSNQYEPQDKQRITIRNERALYPFYYVKHYPMYHDEIELYYCTASENQEEVTPEMNLVSLSSAQRKNLKKYLKKLGFKDFIKLSIDQLSEFVEITQHALFNEGTIPFEFFVPSEVLKAALVQDDQNSDNYSYNLSLNDLIQYRQKILSIILDNKHIRSQIKLYSDITTELKDNISPSEVTLPFTKHNPVQQINKFYNIFNALYSLEKVFSAYEKGLPYVIPYVNSVHDAVKILIDSSVEALIPFRAIFENLYDLIGQLSSALKQQNSVSVELFGQAAASLVNLVSKQFHVNLLHEDRNLILEHIPHLPFYYQYIANLINYSIGSGHHDDSIDSLRNKKHSDKLSKTYADLSRCFNETGNMDVASFERFLGKFLPSINDLINLFKRLAQEVNDTYKISPLHSSYKHLTVSVISEIRGKFFTPLLASISYLEYKFLLEPGFLFDLIFPILNNLYTNYLINYLHTTMFENEHLLTLDGDMFKQECADFIKQLISSGHRDNIIHGESDNFVLRYFEIFSNRYLLGTTLLEILSNHTDGALDLYSLQNIDAKLTEIQNLINIDSYLLPTMSQLNSSSDLYKFDFKDRPDILFVQSIASMLKSAKDSVLLFKKIHNDTYITQYIRKPIANLLYVYDLITLAGGAANSYSVLTSALPDNAYIIKQCHKTQDYWGILNSMWENDIQPYKKELYSDDLDSRVSMLLRLQRHLGIRFEESKIKTYPSENSQSHESKSDSNNNTFLSKWISAVPNMLNSSRQNVAHLKEILTLYVELMNHLQEEYTGQKLVEKISNNFFSDLILYIADIEDQLLLKPGLFVNVALQFVNEFERSLAYMAMENNCTQNSGEIPKDQLVNFVKQFECSLDYFLMADNSIALPLDQFENFVNEFENNSIELFLGQCRLNMLNKHLGYMSILDNSADSYFDRSFKPRYLEYFKKSLREYIHWCFDKMKMDKFLRAYMSCMKHNQVPAIFVHDLLDAFFKEYQTSWSIEQMLQEQNKLLNKICLDKIDVVLPVLETTQNTGYMDLINACKDRHSAQDNTYIGDIIMDDPTLKSIFHINRSSPVFFCAPSYNTNQDRSFVCQVLNEHVLVDSCLLQGISDTMLSSLYDQFLEKHKNTQYIAFADQERFFNIARYKNPASKAYAENLEAFKHEIFIKAVCENIKDDVDVLEKLNQFAHTVDKVKYIQSLDLKTYPQLQPLFDDFFNIQSDDRGISSFFGSLLAGLRR